MDAIVFHHDLLGVMGFLAFLLLGLIAGAIAKAILTGRQAGGWLVTLGVGVVGAILGGWIGSLVFAGGLGDFFDLRTWLLSILGAVLVLLILARPLGEPGSDSQSSACSPCCPCEGVRPGPGAIGGSAFRTRLF